MEVWPVLMSTCWNIPIDMHILWKYDRIPTENFKKVRDPGLIWHPDHGMKNESQRVVSEFYPNPIFLTQNSVKWAQPTLLYTPQLKHNTIILYQWKPSQLTST